MKLHRFFINKPLPKEGKLTVTDENLLNQWRNVLRMAVGDKAILFDGSGFEHLCEFRTLEKKSAILAVIERKKGLVPLHDVTLFMALIKKDNLELVLEKATELGVTRIVPVECARSEKKGINRERSEKILREASEQSGRATVPTLGDIVRVQDIFKKYTTPIVVFDPRGEKVARDFFTTGAPTHIAILIGPEGGFTDEEIEFFKTNKTPILTTGQIILRAETAAIVALSLALI